ncbi:unnamed protein product [Urochloa humidicola]
MAFRVSSIGLVVMCLASLFLVSSFAKEGSGAHDAARNMTSGGIVGADDYVPIPTYGPPTYSGAASRTMTRGVSFNFLLLLFFSVLKSFV